MDNPEYRLLDAEVLAGKIREALGSHNNPNCSVVQCVKALESENAALHAQMQEIVRMAAEKNRPAYDEQQRVIMRLHDEIAALRAELAARGPVLSEHKPLQAADGADMAVYQSIADSYNNKPLVLSEDQVIKVRNHIDYIETEGAEELCVILRNLLERAKR